MKVWRVFRWELGCVDVEVDWQFLFGVYYAGTGNWLVYIGPFCIVIQWATP